jgi:hypothetical protein
VTSLALIGAFGRSWMPSTIRRAVAGALQQAGGPPEFGSHVVGESVQGGGAGRVGAQVQSSAAVRCEVAAHSEQHELLVVAGDRELRQRLGVRLAVGAEVDAAVLERVGQER